MKCRKSVVTLVPVAVLVSVSLSLTEAVNLDYLARHCEGRVWVGDAVHLKLTSMVEYHPDDECSAVVYNDNKERMMVRFLDVNLANSTDCQKDRVELYKTPFADGRPVVAVCGSRIPDKTFIVSSEGMVVRFVSGGSAGFPGFDLLVTPFYTGPCDDNSFQCDNKRCIADSLACNGLNNCGDFSDEKYGCGLSTGFLAAIGLVSVAVVCVIVVVVVLFASKKCSRNSYVRVP